MIRNLLYHSCLELNDQAEVVIEFWWGRDLLRMARLMLASVIEIFFKYEVRKLTGRKCRSQQHLRDTCIYYY